MSTAERLERLETRIRNDFPDVKLEFTWQVFAKHAELWVYVLRSERFDEVRDQCRVLGEEALAMQEPEIWLLPQNWTVPWPGSDPAAEAREAERLNVRRDDFRRRHNLVRAGA